MEANPGTITLEKFEGYLRAGVNRLSMGVHGADPRLTCCSRSLYLKAISYMQVAWTCGRFSIVSRHPWIELG